MHTATRPGNQKRTSLDELVCWLVKQGAELNAGDTYPWTITHNCQSLIYGRIGKASGIPLNVNSPVLSVGGIGAISTKP
jgi:hypothetical protein